MVDGVITPSHSQIELRSDGSRSGWVRSRGSSDPMGPDPDGSDPEGLQILGWLGSEVIRSGIGPDPDGSDSSQILSDPQTS